MALCSWSLRLVYVQATDSFHATANVKRSQRNKLVSPFHCGFVHRHG